MDLTTFDAYGNSIVVLCHRIQKHEFSSESEIDAGIAEATKIEATLHNAYEDSEGDVNDGIISLMEFPVTERKQIAEGYLHRMEECQSVLFNAAKAEINFYPDVISVTFKRLLRLLKSSWGSVAWQWHEAVSKVLEKAK